MISYLEEISAFWNVRTLPRWKYSRNLESPRVPSPGFGNDSEFIIIFSLQSDSPWTFIWRPPDTHHHQENIIERHRFGGAGLLVYVYESDVEIAVISPDIRDLTDEDEGYENEINTAERYSVFAEEAIQFTVNGRNILMERKRKKRGKRESPKLSDERRQSLPPE
ncbi:DDE_3 domain-containing protein [Trichonephila clavipes]|nr:DDE_3 domain-containing protein [Trichonephila clavipes]